MYSTRKKTTNRYEEEARVLLFNCLLRHLVESRAMYRYWDPVENNKKKRLEHVCWCVKRTKNYVNQNAMHLNFFIVLVAGILSKSLFN